MRSAGSAHRRRALVVDAAGLGVGGPRAAGPVRKFFQGLAADIDPFHVLKQGAAADPAQAAVVESGELGTFRANYEAFSHESGPHAELAASGVPTLLYAGTSDPWHDPMRAFAERSGFGFFSVPGTDLLGAWAGSAAVLPHVLPFLEGGRAPAV
jgi:hypothetical protein